MATGKNKKYKAGSVKKGSKRKVIEPFAKKEWYNVKVPKNFKKRNVGQIVVNKSTGTKSAIEGLRGRVVEANLADLLENEKYALYNYKFRCEDVNGKRLFNGFPRIFCIGFTTRRPNQIKKTSYAQTAQIKKIRRVMVNMMNKEAASRDINNLVDYLKDNKISKEIVTRCQKIFPLDNVYIRKVKLLKSAQIDSLKLLEQHQDEQVATKPVEQQPAVEEGETVQA
ncbi:Small ribosomal subunit protein eS1 [Entamoeba marina]